MCFVDVCNGHTRVLGSEGRSICDQASTPVPAVTSHRLVAALCPRDALVLDDDDATSWLDP